MEEISSNRPNRAKSRILFLFYQRDILERAIINNVNGAFIDLSSVIYLDRPFTAGPSTPFLLYQTDILESAIIGNVNDTFIDLLSVIYLARPFTARPSTPFLLYQTDILAWALLVMLMIRSLIFHMYVMRVEIFFIVISIIILLTHWKKWETLYLGQP